AAEIAQALSGQNDARRRIAEQIEAEAIDQAERAGMTEPGRRAIVLASPDWHPGVVGIVCSRLVERYHRPVVLLCADDDGTCRGSARSVDGYNLHDALCQCAEPLETFGGHAMAAGLRVAPGKLDAFAELLIAHANAAIAPEDLVARFAYDTDARLDEFTEAAAHDLERLGPFGRDNPRPRLRLLNAQLFEPARRMGSSGAHLTLRLKQQGRIVRCVAWKKGDIADRLPRGARVHALVTPKINEWNGRRSVECEIADLTLADT
ncbi:MAG: DHHA1 domain-containing protein, partial [Planctomycetota bacterium]